MKIYPKSDAKKETKKESVKRHNLWPAQCGVSPNPIISKDILRSEVQQVSTLRKSMRGEYKVECKKWSAERQVQSVSAERQVQTGNPLRTQTRSVVTTTCGYPSACGKVPHVVAERGFHRWGFLRCGCVRKVFQHLLFYKNGFEHQQKVKPNRTKTRFLKKFDIRREPKGSQREPKGSQREPKASQREPKASQRTTKMHQKINAR